MENHYVCYYRVSTREQESKGLGLEAQKMAVKNYIQKNGNRIIAEFTEIESGRNNNRTELAKAIRLTKEKDAILCIAKLDRLSRNVYFISSLMESKVRFVCCDMPDANELTIHIFASLAEWERKRISERTREALAAKRIREPDWKPGTDNFTDEGRRKSGIRRRALAKENENLRHAYNMIRLLRERGVSFWKIARELNESGYTTSRGKQFHAVQALRLYELFKDNQKST